jgi:hypothetical protein
LRKVQINDSIDIINYKLLAEYQKKLVKRADSIINTDIVKANDILALGWKTNKGESFNFGSLLRSVLGWIITALAISLGAPFWYDLLNKFMKLRSSVATPTSDDREKKQG